MKQGKKYYENKWYGYNRPNEGDLRDDYYKAKVDYFSSSNKIIHLEPIFPARTVISFAFVVLSIFLYDFLGTYGNKKEKEWEEVKKVL